MTHNENHTITYHNYQSGTDRTGTITCSCGLSVEVNYRKERRPSAEARLTKLHKEKPTKKKKTSKKQLHDEDAPAVDDIGRLDDDGAPQPNEAPNGDQS